MTTLTSSPLSSLLPRLFGEADATQASLMQRFGELSPAERIARMAAAQDDARGFYAQLKDVHLAVSPETGRLLYMLARALRARVVVEFGTSFGISTLHLAAALRDNGGGRLIGSEYEPSKVQQARAHLQQAGLHDLCEIREGDALQSFARDMPAPIDLVLLDGAKPLYGSILSLLEPKLSPGALLVADNADTCPEYIARVRAAGSGYLSVPLSAELELSMRVGNPAPV